MATFTSYQRLGYAYTLPIGSSATTGARQVPAGTFFIRLTASVDCWIVIANAAASPTADTVASTFLPGRWPDIFRVAPGDVISVIADSANNPSGVLSVTELSQ